MERNINTRVRSRARRDLNGLIHGGASKNMNMNMNMAIEGAAPHLINEEELLAVHIHLKDDTGHLSGERLVFLPPNPASFEL